MLEINNKMFVSPLSHHKQILFFACKDQRENLQINDSHKNQLLDCIVNISLTDHVD